MKPTHSNWPPELEKDQSAFPEADVTPWLAVGPLLQMQDCITIQPSLLTVIISMTWKQFHGPLVGILLLRAHVFCLPLVGHLEEAAAASIGTALVGVRYLEDSAKGESRIFRCVTSMT